MLKALSALIAAIPMSSVFTATVFNEILGLAMPTASFDMLFHDDSIKYRNKSMDLTRNFPSYVLSMIIAHGSEAASGSVSSLRPSRRKKGEQHRAFSCQMQFPQDLSTD
ncbi:MAG: hypothetical protein ACTFAK_07095 [Candidatus Electronema sp. VV]